MRHQQLIASKATFFYIDWPMTLSRIPPIILIILIWFAGLGAAAQFAKVALTFEQLQNHYDQFGTSSGLLVSLISFLGVLLGQVAGLLGARFGYRKLLLVGLWVGAVVSLLQALMPPFHIMLASRIIEGASHLAIVVAAPTIISAIATPKQQGFALTLWGTFFGVAFTAIAIIAPMLVELGGLELVFIAHGFYLIVITLILTFTVPTVKDLAAKGSAKIGIAEFLKLHIDTFRSPFIAAPAIGWLFYTLTFVSLIAVMPQFLSDQHEVTVMTAIPLASIVSSMTLGVFLLRFIRPIAVVITGFVLAIGVMFAFWLVPHNPVIPIVLFAALGLVQGASFAAVPDLNENIDNRAKAYGAIAQMGNLGNLCGTPLLIAIISIWGFTGIVFAVSAIYLAAVVAHLWLSALRNRHANLH